MIYLPYNVIKRLPNSGLIARPEGPALAIPESVWIIMPLNGILKNMTNKSFTNRTDRRSRLIGLLQSEEYWKTADLREQLGVSQRTLMRELAELSTLRKWLRFCILSEICTRHEHTATILRYV